MRITNFSELSVRENIVYSYLSFRQGKHYGCYPSIKKIAADTGISESTVRRAIKGLEQKMFVKKILRFKGDGGETTNFYLCLV